MSLLFGLPFHIKIINKRAEGLPFAHKGLKFVEKYARD